MVKTTSQIEIMNQSAIELEYSAVIIIHATFKSLLDELLLDAEDALKDELVQRCNASLKAMLYAESIEDFFLQKKRMNEWLTLLKKKADLLLGNKLDSSLDEYRFHQTLHDLLTHSDANSFRDMYFKLPKKHTETAEFIEWKESLDSLDQTSTEDEFDKKKCALIQELDEVFASPLNNTVARDLVIIEDNFRNLQRSRLAYLKNTNDRYKILGKFSWVSIDYGLLIFAIVVGLGFNPLGVPLLGLAIASLVYAVLDLLHNSTELYEETIDKQFGNSEIQTATKKPLIEQFQKDLGIDLSELFDKQTSNNQSWLSETKILRMLCFGASFVGGLLAASGLALLMFPTLGLPFYVFILTTILGIVVSSVGAGSIYWNIYQNQQHLRTTKEQVISDITEDTDTLEAAFENLLPAEQTTPLTHHNDQHLTSTAYLMEEEIMSTTSSDGKLEDPLLENRAKDKRPTGSDEPDLTNTPIKFPGED